MKKLFPVIFVFLLFSGFSCILINPFGSNEFREYEVSSLYVYNRQQAVREIPLSSGMTLDLTVYGNDALAIEIVTSPGRFDGLRVIVDGSDDVFLYEYPYILGVEDGWDCSPGDHSLKCIPLYQTSETIINGKEFFRSYGISDTRDLTVDVNSLVTNDNTPPLSGMLSHAYADVTVTVNGTGYDAVPTGNGEWQVPDNTVATLADGTYDITVRADLSGSFTEITVPAALTIDTVFPIVTFADCTRDVTQPALSGTVNDESALCRLEIDGNSYQCINNGNGTWSLAAGIIQELSDGEYPVTVFATDLAGNTGISSGTCAIVSSSQQIIFDASNDTYTDESFPDSSYPSLNRLYTHAGAGITKDAYLRFDLSAIPGTITYARIVIILSTNNGYADVLHQVYRCQGNWDENLVTWNNPPVVIEPIGSAMVFQSGSGNEILVTDAAEAARLDDGWLGIKISSLTECPLRYEFSSLENGMDILKPKIEIHYIP